MRRKRARHIGRKAQGLGEAGPGGKEAWLQSSVEKQEGRGEQQRD